MEEMIGSEHLRERFPLARRLEILQLLQRNDAIGSEEKFIADEQLQNASKDEAVFLDTINAVIDRHPAVIFRIGWREPALLSPEKVRELCARLIYESPSSLIYESEALASLLSADERKKLIIEALDAQPPLYRAKVIFNNFTSDKIGVLFTEEERRQYAKYAFEHMPVDAMSINSDWIKKFLDQGLVDVATVRAFALRILHSENNMGSAQGLLENLPPEMYAEFKAALVEAFMRKNQPLGLSYLNDYRDFLSSEEMTTIFRERARQHPEEIASNIKNLAKYLPPEQVRDCIEEFIDKRVPNFFMWSWKEALDMKILSPEKEAELWKIVAQKYPSQIMREGMEEYLARYPATEHGAMVRELVDRMPPQIAVTNIDTWLPHLSGDPNEQKAIARDMIMSHNGFDFVARFLREGMVAKLFTKEDMLEMLDRQADLGGQGLADSIDDIREFLGNDIALKKFIMRVVETNPVWPVSNFKKIAYLFDETETRGFVEAVASQPRGMISCIESVEEWGPAAGNEYVYGFVKKHMQLHAVEMMTVFRKIIPFIPKTEHSVVAAELVAANPGAGYFYLSTNDQFADHLKGQISKETVFKDATADGDRFGMAPRTLGKLFKRIEKSANIEEAVPLLTEVVGIYGGIASIRETGMVDGVRHFQEQGISENDEMRIFEMCQCLGMLNPASKEIRDAVHGMKEGSELKQFLVERIARRLGIERHISQEEAQNFLETMESPAPFTLYYLQYEHSPAHEELLRGIFDAIMTGKYDEWKYGPPTEESLNDLRARKLVPEKITFEQYTAWRNDNTTDLFESLSVDGAGVAKKIREYLFENQEHLAAEGIREALQDPELALHDIGAALSDLGQKLAAAHRETGTLRRLGEELTEVGREKLRLGEERRRELERQKKTLETMRSILRISNLSPAEVASGELISGKDKKKSGEAIGKVLKQVAADVPHEARFVVETVERILADYRNQNAEKQNLRCVDATSPKYLFEVGAKPVSSCQHYAHGSYNDCLIGYADPNTKILMLLNEKGNPVARSIFRLMSDDAGTPVIHAERIYASSASPGVDRSIYSHVTKKAELLKVPSYANKFSQTEEGLVEPLKIPAGFNIEDSEERLHSYASRAPKVYVDSAGGEQSFGKYDLNGVFRIAKIEN